MAKRRIAASDQTHIDRDLRGGLAGGRVVVVSESQPRRHEAAATQSSVKVAVVPGFSAPIYPGYAGVGKFPADNPQLSAYHFTPLAANNLNAASLASYDTVILYGIRWSSISAGGQAALNTFAATHKVMIWDSDGTGPQNYSTFIHPFSTLASNASGQPQDSVVTYPAGNNPYGNDFLASSNPSSPYYLDPSQLVSDPSMINDMNAMKTGTKNWLPGLAAENKNIPQGGWPLAWSYGVIRNRTGLTIYSGLDADAIDNSQLVPNDEITELLLQLKAPFRTTPQSCGPTCMPPTLGRGRHARYCSFAKRIPRHWVHGRVSIWLKCSPAAGSRQGGVDALRTAPRVRARKNRSDPAPSTDATDADEPHLATSGRLWQQSTDQEQFFRLKVDNTPPRLLYLRTAPQPSGRQCRSG